MDTKEFKTITLRGLDDFDNSDVVRIMNEVMKQKGIKTAQTAIETIIREYNRNNQKIAEQEKKIKTLLEETRNLKDQNKEQSNKLYSVKEFFKLVQAL